MFAGRGGGKNYSYATGGNAETAGAMQMKWEMSSSVGVARG